MKSELIIINEYCIQARLDPDFIVQLEDEGLIEVNVIGNERYIDLSQLSSLERYARLHYDLSINVEGISVIQNLLNRVSEMQEEMQALRQRVRLLDDNNDYREYENL